MAKPIYIRSRTVRAHWQNSIFGIIHWLQFSHHTYSIGNFIARLVPVWPIHTSGGLVILKLVQLDKSFNEQDELVHNLEINAFIRSPSKMFSCCESVISRSLISRSISLTSNAFGQILLPVVNWSIGIPHPLEHLCWKAELIKNEWSWRCLYKSLLNFSLFFCEFLQVLSNLYNISFKLLQIFFMPF